MSRIGRLPITVPSGVDVSVERQTARLRGLLQPVDDVPEGAHA